MTTKSTLSHSLSDALRTSVSDACCRGQRRPGRLFGSDRTACNVLVVVIVNFVVVVFVVAEAATVAVRRRGSGQGRRVSRDQGLLCNQNYTVFVRVCL